ncbi:MAG: hypothetical protein HXX08_08850 [Chloroflexi bacterium]|uniref:Uncharacterized protein n=1 Tax=Candidatus Chlorohelix allophototropha TaxID=3003348 RepID=A0A8T7M253_9CHLR|nr:hypothetical protein [Chloroflexota bacterium]WJW67832.1 hypothetical protein OZ401_001114 [Chloroflexota bacterium L227-S17]
MQNIEIPKLAGYCKQVLSLENSSLPPEYSYRSLPLCVIDAVFSIGVTYTSTSNTVLRFCNYFGLERYADMRPPAFSDQLTLSVFTALYTRLGVEEMAEKVYQNRQRTSPKNGLLKAEAVLQFAQVLEQFEVNYFQDISKVLGNEAFETAIKKIPGQHSGVSLQYFFMLAGSDDLVKPDRMVLRFMGEALGYPIKLDTVQQALAAVNSELKLEYPTLTPRKLDYLIWQYQRTQPNK